MWRRTVWREHPVRAATALTSSGRFFDTSPVAIASQTIARSGVPKRLRANGSHKKACADDADTAVVFVIFASAFSVAAFFGDPDEPAAAIFATAIFIVHGAQYNRAAALARSCTSASVLRRKGR